MELRKIDQTNARIVFPDIEAKASISIVGLGYVGAVSTACLASLGHRVVGVDIDPVKRDQIAMGQSPIHERMLGETLSQGVSDGLISTTDDLAAAVLQTDVTFVSVGTPTAADGGCDYSYIEQAAQSMAAGLRDKDRFHVFAMRCSIPPGTTMKIMASILEEGSGKVAGRDFGICFNPEFLREGVAIDDFHNPPKTVIGASDLRTAEIMRAIYAPVDAAPIFTTVEVAETIKYVDNVWHATKVCFANEVGRLCKPLGVDSHAVMEIFTQDRKLNLSPYYLKPGFAYGGSCLPKEVRAVQHIADDLGVSLPLIESLNATNACQIDAAVEMALKTGAKRIGVLGLAFKPGTDDLRESPILEAIAKLREKGIDIIAHDPAVTTDTAIEGQLAYVANGSPGLARLAGELRGFLADTPGEVVEHADAVIVTQRNPIYAGIAEFAAQAVGKPVIDLVRLFDTCPDTPTYQGIGW